jgi:hypothetical protein
MVDLSVKIGDIRCRTRCSLHQAPSLGSTTTSSTSTGSERSWQRRSAASRGSATRRRAWPKRRLGIIQSIGLPGKGIEYFVDHIVPEYAKFTPPLAGMGEHGGAVSLNVLVEAQSGRRALQQRRQRGLAHLERLAPQVIAVQFDQDGASSTSWPP